MKILMLQSYMSIICHGFKVLKLMVCGGNIGLWLIKTQIYIDANGKREIAAHYYPLIGPYSTSDVDLQKYHLLLMKLVGIDGVIFDWYGSRNVLDFELIKNGTESFLLGLEDMGLSFAICFEDRAIGVDGRKLTSQEMTLAQNDMLYIEQSYFSKENYIKINEENLLLVFGPQYIDEPEDWDLIFSNIDTPVTVNALWGSQNLIGDYADGEFAWIDKSHLLALEGYYQWVANFEENTIAGAAYIGLNDFYVEGLWRAESVEEWSLPHEGTTVFQETLNLTSQYPVDFIQLITWNDFGEGTMMEPTIEFGYSFLEELQDFAGVEFSHDDLRVPYYIYMYSKQHANNLNAMYFINLAYYHACNSNLQYAKTLLSIVNIFYN